MGTISIVVQSTDDSGRTWNTVIFAAGNVRNLQAAEGEIINSLKTVRCDIYRRLDKEQVGQIAPTVRRAARLRILGED